MADLTEAPTESKKWKPTARVNPDGSLFNADHERVAIRLAEGMQFHDCWTAIGKKAKDNQQRKYRNHLLRQEVFKNRVKTIMEEREQALASDDVYGEPLFVTMQFYREAFALGDIARMQKAVEMRLQIAKEIGARRGAPPAQTVVDPDADAPPDAEVAAKPVGRPTVESPQTKSTPADLRKQLLEKASDAAPTPMAAE